jgi:DNA-binding GntR family transcriptional regulator
MMQAQGRRPRNLAGLPKAERLALPESIADAVAEAIAARHILPGDRIVETTLAEQMGASRVPTREALKVLHTQGILLGGGYRGYRVASFEGESVRKVFEVRLMLETFLLRDAIRCWRSAVSDPRLLDQAIEQLATAARAGDFQASLRADLGFHRTIAQAARNDLTARLWETIARHVLIIFSLDRYRDDDLSAVVAQHEQFRDFILKQIEKPGTLDVLRRGLENHLLLGARAKAQRRRMAAGRLPPTRPTVAEARDIDRRQPD